LHSAEKKAVKKMSNKKASEDDNVPGDVFKMLADNGFKVMIN
jgi:hypothetical protein